MTTKWFSRGPGEPPLSIEEDGSVCMLIGDSLPDWVEIPKELGGGKGRVVDGFHRQCPCNKKHSVRHLSVGKGIYVAECKHNGFIWYTTKERKKDGSSN